MNKKINSSEGPLSGVRVIDLTINVLGPVATQMLGDMGADIIKVEPPEGDPMRGVGVARNKGMPAFFLNMNRNKRSVILDLKKASDLEHLIALVKSADVLVHSMRPKAAAKLGINYEAMVKHNPRLIHACAPGYESTGPYKDRPAYDDVIQGESGIADMMQMATGTVGYLPTVVADKTCGVFLALAISMALFSREKTGKGQEVQVPMMESMLAFNLIEHFCTGAFGDSEGIGYARMLSPNRRPFRTKDGNICLLAINDEQWKRLLKVLGRDDVIQDPEFSTISARTKNIDKLYGIVAKAVEEFETDALSKLLDEADVPNGRVNRLRELFGNDYLKTTEFFNRYDHPSEGELITPKEIARFSETPGGLRFGPPRLGEHTAEILREIY